MIINTDNNTATMGDLTLETGPTVKMIRHMGDDGAVVQAARVSVIGENGEEVEVPQATLQGPDAGLINYLMREKHGSPFEHTGVTFYVKAPIFVFREFMRHRIGFSYNEMSGRYTELPPEFYIPGKDRPTVNSGKASKPEMIMAENEDERWIRMRDFTEVYELAWKIYQKRLARGDAPEVARIVLPVGLYSQMYVTMNLRSALSFLSLRTHRPDARHVSRPQYEIAQVAELIEEQLRLIFPASFESFDKNGRVAP